MECPSCGKKFEKAVIFCPRCGKRLPQIIKDQNNQEIGEVLGEISSLNVNHNLSTPPQKVDAKNNIEKNNTDSLSYDTDDPRKKEYKKILKEIFADKCVTAEEWRQLAAKRKEYDFDNDVVENIHYDISNEFGFDIGDLLSGVILDINENKIHMSGEASSLEIRISNVSETNLEKVYISGNIPHFNHFVEKQVGKLKKYSGKTEIYLPFQCQQPGDVHMEILLEYFDTQGNPSVYRANIPIKIKKYENSRANIFNIENKVSFQYERASAGDYEKMINFGNLGEMIQKDKPEEKSSYHTERRWVSWCFFFDEEETHKRRDKIIIDKKFREGEDKFHEGVRQKKDAERMDKNAAIEAFRGAFNWLKDAKDCFKKIRELDPEHSVSFERVKEIRRMISEIENRIGVLEKEPVAPPIKLSSGCLTMQSPQKKIYIYSKDKITVGRDSKNDMVLRMVPYQPKEQYSENWGKSRQISGTHAVIINKAGQFYIQDIGSENTGSTSGTFIDGKKMKPLEEYPLRDNVRINIARVLDLECTFLGEFKHDGKEPDSLSSCFTVLGEMSDSCFGIDKKSNIDAIKIRRRNNYVDGEKYIILIREIKIGRSFGNGIVLNSDKVSDIHAKIFYRDDQYWLEDLNSRHGTWVNGKQANPGIEVSLGKQSELIIGNINMNFEGFA